MACYLPAGPKTKVICDGPSKTVDSTHVSKISAATSDTEAGQTIHIHAASAPIPLKTPSQVLVKAQISAPSYLNSLRENDAPPFRKPEREKRPRLIIGNIMHEDEAVVMVAVAESDTVTGLKKFLGEFLVKKNIIVNFNISERNFLISFLKETIDYAARRDFDAFKLSVLITIYLDAHLHCKRFYWESPTVIWEYFKEIMIRHTIEDSPDGQEVFEPEECYDILSHFHTLYMSNLPLVHLLTFGAYRLKFLWPFKPK